MTGVQTCALPIFAAGVDLLDISGGLIGAPTPDWDGISQGYFVPTAAAVRAVVDVPVVVAGGITDPLYADPAIVPCRKEPFDWGWITRLKAHLAA